MSQHPARRRIRKGYNEALVFHAMYLMAKIDGGGDEGEQAALFNAVETLPFLRDSDVDELARVSQGLVKKYGGLIPSLEALIEIDDPGVRLQCFLVSAEVAYASGDINPAEAQLLESMQKILQLDPAETRQIMHVLALRYATVE